MAKKLLIIGWGFWGLRTFYNLAWDKNFEITLIDKRVTSSMKPALPEVAFEGKDVNKTRFDLRSVVEGKGAKFINDSVKTIDAEKNSLTLETGATVEYDYLVVSAWANKAFTDVAGLEKHGYSMCDDEHAPKIWEALENFKWGKIMIGSAKSTWGTRVKSPDWVAPCEGPIWEGMFMIHHYLEKKWLRDKTEITAFTPGEPFFEDIWDDVRNWVGWLMEQKKIGLLQNHEVKEVKEKSIVFENGEEVESDLTIMIPVYKGQQFLIDSKLADEKGFLPTDEAMRHLDYKNIFGAGDLNAITMPKLGHLAVMQADIITAQLKNELGWKMEIPKYKPEILCIMWMGGNEAAVVLSDVNLGGKYDVVWYGKWQGLFKKQFDLYNILTKGKMPPAIGEHMFKWAVKKFGGWKK